MGIRWFELVREEEREREKAVAVGGFCSCKESAGWGLRAMLLDEMEVDLVGLLEDWGKLSIATGRPL